MYTNEKYYTNQFDKNIIIDRLDWEDYRFVAHIGGTQFVGRIHSGKATKDTHIDSVMYRRYIKYFKLTTCYCLFRNMPFVEHLEKVYFDIVRNNDKEWLHLEYFECIYNKGVLTQGNTYADLNKSDIADHIRKNIKFILSGYEAQCGYMRLRGLNLIDNKNLQILITNNSCADIDCCYDSEYYEKINEKLNEELNEE